MTPEVRNKLIEELMPMARRLSRRCARMYLCGDRDTAESVAMTELCRRVEAYSEDTGVSLRTYCYRYIRRKIRDEGIKEKRYDKSGRARGIARAKLESATAEIRTGLSDAHDEIAKEFWISRYTLTRIAKCRRITRREVIKTLLECRSALREVLTCRTRPISRR